MKRSLFNISLAMVLGVCTVIWFAGCKAEVKSPEVAAGGEIHGDHDGHDHDHDHDHDHEGHDHAEGEAVVAEAGAAAADLAAAVIDYPLTTCVVSGEGLDSMGGPVDIQHDGNLVRLCCKSCVKSFNKTPEKFLAAIAEAKAKATAE